MYMSMDRLWRSPVLVDLSILNAEHFKSRPMEIVIEGNNPFKKGQMLQAQIGSFFKSKRDYSLVIYVEMNDGYHMWQLESKPSGVISLDSSTHCLLQYTPAVDIWSIGCIFAEVLSGRPLFPGKNVVHQLDLMTDVLGTPSTDAIARIRNDKARKYLASMRKKAPISFAQKFPKADPLALRLLERLLAFDPKDRPSAEEALADPYFKGLAKGDREPSAQPIIKVEFEFERQRMSKDVVRDLIYKEILEYHPHMLKDQLLGTDNIHFMYPSAVNHFKKQFNHLEENYNKGHPCKPLDREHSSLPRARLPYSRGEAIKCSRGTEKQEQGLRDIMKAPPRPSYTSFQEQAWSARYSCGQAKPGRVIGPGFLARCSGSEEESHPRRLAKSSCVGGSLHSIPAQTYSRRIPSVNAERNGRNEEFSSEASNIMRTRPNVNGHGLPHRGC
eukprot:Gb_05455 [translate_table: standard]